MRYHNIVFMQECKECEECCEILENHGPQGLMEHMKQWDLGEHYDTFTEPPWGEADRLYREGKYVLSYNTGLGSFGLTLLEEGP